MKSTIARSFKPQKKRIFFFHIWQVLILGMLKTFISIRYWFLVDFFFIYDKYEHGIGIDIKQGCLKWCDMFILYHLSCQCVFGHINFVYPYGCKNNNNNLKKSPSLPLGHLMTKNGFNCYILFNHHSFGNQNYLVTFLVAMILTIKMFNHSFNHHSFNDRNFFCY